jgi:hypothetical protein
MSAKRPRPRAGEAVRWNFKGKGKPSALRVIGWDIAGKRVYYIHCILLYPVGWRGKLN